MKKDIAEISKKLITSTTTLFWFRRDLRLQDNAGLYHALKENNEVLPIFIFDTEILDKLEDRSDKRVEFIHQSLALIQKELENLGCSLLILHGNPVEIYKELNPKAVYANHDYEPYAIQRDAQIKKLLEKKSVAFKSYKDQVIFEKDEITKDDGKPYTIFTPYSRKWKAALTKFYLKSFPTEKYFGSFKKVRPLPFPTLADFGFNETHPPFQCDPSANPLLRSMTRRETFPRFTVLRG